MITRFLAEVRGVRLFSEFDETAGTTSNPRLRVWSEGMIGRDARLRISRAGGSAIVYDNRVAPNVREKHNAEFDNSWPGSVRMVERVDRAGNTFLSPDWSIFELEVRD